MRSIAITGANGFIGKAMVNHFLNKNWKVFGLCRNPDQLQIFHPNFVSIPYNLEQGFRPETISEPIDAILHLAFQPYSSAFPNAYEVNLNEVRNLLRIASGTTLKLIYFSSMSAHLQAESMYGKHKLEAEKLLENSNALILKPGLVLGNGGMLLKIHAMMQKLPMVPLIDGGKQPVQTIDVNELCEASYRLLEQNKQGIWCMAERHPTTMRNLYFAIAQAMNKKVIFLPLPYALVWFPAWLADRLKISLPINLENLLGLKKLTSFDTFVTENTIKFNFGSMNAIVAKYKAILQHD
ncbi:MAG: NAD(P)-dependent oxidoreductase [Bacteroidia bacterium]|nr:NAD(P)-dependent oxidoreductase [Bacteroidia bacterium]